LTADNIEQQLQLINIKSQELLKRLEINIDDDESLDTDKITQLQTEREQLISHLFAQYSKSDIEKELSLINVMVNLDTDLQIKTEALKQSFANKLIKIKKGQKSAKTYKKY
jgi:Arc/MetJ family transcription regulator